MAQSKKTTSETKESQKKTSFEEKLSRLQILSEEIKNPDTGLEDALSIFEEGIKLAKSLETELDKIENKIQILINQPKKSGEKPELDLFSSIPED